MAREDVVIDRSIYEDRDIMARSWERFWDARARRTYEDCAKSLSGDLPAPDVIVLCRCSREESDRRLLTRNREKKHPSYDPEWLSRLEVLYADWVREFIECPLLELDTERFDVRDAAVVEAVLQDIEVFLAPRPADQTLLFDLTGDPQPEPLFELDAPPALQVLRPLNGQSETGVDLRPLGLQRPLPGSVSYPAVYVAAPFSAFADEPEPLSQELRLPVDLREHGTLPSLYRSLLEKTSAALKRKGFHPFLPHRDLNAWGNRSLSPVEAVGECLRAVLMCDGFLAVPGTSFGVHTEAGVALAAGKPMVFVEVEELETSFFGQGLMQAQDASRLRVSSLEDLPKIIEQSDIFPQLLPYQGSGGFQR